MVLACQLMCALSLLVPKTVSGLLRSGVVHQVLWISQNVDTYKESGSVVLSPKEERHQAILEVRSEELK
ncbi:hypothetical protein Y1Q_0013670 [Alligator mississippiensis]|uniref:Uncharacterized protein n=1 Tax=Alligator mississippiensis TaxID=8496 RepID=A0A151P4J3_ALLMI|nr:hypothetical protein Y1Q_0013670 [Alligator mississippiensis]